MKTLADRVKAERIAAALTQPGLGDAVGVTKQAISKIESGQTQNPELETFFRLAGRFGVTPEWLGLGREPRVDDGLSRLSRRDLEILADAADLVAQKDGTVTADALVLAYQRLRRVRVDGMANVAVLPPPDPPKPTGPPAHGTNTGRSEGTVESAGRKIGPRKK